MLSADFLDRLLEKYASNSIIHITDEHTQILASTDSLRVGMNSSTAQYIVQVMRPSVIERENQDDWMIYGTPVFLGGELRGTVVVRGQASSVQQGVAVRAALEAALEYDQYSRTFQDSDERGQIARLMLSGQANADKLVSMMNRQEIDPALLRTAICVSLQFHQTSYFNINLRLGYQSSIEIVRNEAAMCLKGSRHLNTQDFVLIYDRNTIVVIKSFIPTFDYSRIYLALDKICQDFIQDLGAFSAFSLNMAYGNIYGNVADLKKSFEEACEIIQIGKKTGRSERLYILENILFDNIYHNLHPQVSKKLLEPNLKKLEKKDGSLRAELLDCAEHFIDNCMNISATSEKSMLHRNTIRARLEKLQSLTGLDPTNSFYDAFIIKMLAVRLRQDNDVVDVAK
ncbi:MAG: helix-turn-helix domain-containing protein [Defluviitaleaceae bacterium]|nr:helix-turn-helix domain-containing protein [Defluviitaleaceae bacterium]